MFSVRILGSYIPLDDVEPAANESPMNILFC
jgi:hypothetical protein